jgi:diaminohydroxyphosphoribosylaminopyrimidine deaminase/5-amino-6-(5-phosphoribosylamino)uracil reductase
MSEDDDNFMKEAIIWAQGCKPIEDAIPNVGAIIAVGRNVIGRGRRGTGAQGDDEHAEWKALEEVRRDHNETSLPQATLYTTLEPCTGEVRMHPHKSCTELILRSAIKRVVIGILDPNQ